MKKTVKRSLIWFGIFTFVIIATYVAGTFNPNSFVLTQIEDEVHKKEMKIVEELGLKEPEFEFKDKISFVNALDYLAIRADTELEQVP